MRSTFYLFVSSVVALAAADNSNPFNIPKDGYEFKVGEATTLSWDPTSDGTISLKLQSGDVLVPEGGTPIASHIDNSGSYDWTPPKDLVNQSDYTIEILDDEDHDAVNYLPRFTVSGATASASSSAASSTSTGSTGSTGSNGSTGSAGSNGSNDSTGSGSGSSSSSVTSGASASTESPTATSPSTLTTEMSTTGSSASSTTGESSSAAGSSTASGSSQSTGTSTGSSSDSSASSSASASASPSGVSSDTSASIVNRVSGGMMAIVLGAMVFM